MCMCMCTWVSKKTGLGRHCLVYFVCRPGGGLLKSRLSCAYLPPQSANRMCFLRGKEDGKRGQMWTCFFSCLSFSGSRSRRSVCSSLSSFISVVCGHTRYNFVDTWLLLLSCFTWPPLPLLLTRPLKIWGISCCLNYNKQPTSVSAKAKMGGRNANRNQMVVEFSFWRLQLKLKKKRLIYVIEPKGEKKRRENEKYILCLEFKLSCELVVSSSCFFISKLTQGQKLAANSLRITLICISIVLFPKQEICYRMYVNVYRCLHCWIIKCHWNEQSMRTTPSPFSLVKRYGKTWHGCVWKPAGWT